VVIARVGKVHILAGFTLARRTGSALRRSGSPVRIGEIPGTGQPMVAGSSGIRSMGKLHRRFLQEFLVLR
jgi:hypothetical protein